jgi:hypothetical protein
MIRQFSSRLARHLALASFVVLGFALPAAAEGMITGTVVDAQGNPVADAKITIEQTDGVTRKFETKSDKKGSFIQIGLQSASFKVTAEAKAGTATANARVSQRGPSTVRLIIGAGSTGDPAVAAKTAELRKAFDEGVALSRDGKYADSVALLNRTVAFTTKSQDYFSSVGLTYSPTRTTRRPKRITRKRSK